MEGQRLRTAIAVACALAAAGATAVLLAGSAAAEASDCHVDQTCPSADHSYTWSDGTTLWDCAVADGSSANDPDVTVIVYEGISYACFAVPTDTTVTTPEPPAPPPTPPEETPSKPKPKPKPKAKPSPPPAPEVTPYRPQAPARRPNLAPGRYVFPLDGPVSYGDTFGAARSDTGWHHGEDLFAPLGTPIVAVANGTLLKVGWNAVGGNRVWLRDSWGNYFYYAHLSGFAPGSQNGAPVFRGEVIGYVGNTGDAAGTPYHLHFEIHPGSMLDLGYDGVVNPYPYLRRWQQAGDLIRTGQLGGAAAPTPGAILLTAADISSASGLRPSTVVRRASAPVTYEANGPLLPPLAPVSQQSVPGSPDVAGVLDSAASSLEDVPGASVWDTLAECESGGDWHANTGLFDGGVQFHPDTWTRYGGAEFAPYAYLATREQQITIARRVLGAEGWEAWPACSLKLGLR